MSERVAFTRYQPRPVSFLGLELVNGHRLKVYSVRHNDQPLDRARFDAGWALAMTALPQPDVSLGRPGLGFVILHQGATGDYLILSWWDRENELPTHVFVRDANGWRSAVGGESFCVWDLGVIWWERETYVATVLADHPYGEEEYITNTIEGYA